MKTIFCVICLILTTNAFAIEAGDGWNSLAPSLPSCSLYRHRLADYFQRNQEVNLVLKMKKGMFTKDELKNIETLWDRTEIPLLQKESVVWKKELDLTAQPFSKEDVASVEVQSEVFEWQDDKFEFPEEVLRFSKIENNKVSVEFEMPYMQSCLVINELNINLVLKNGETRSWKFNIKR